MIIVTLFICTGIILLVIASLASGLIIFAVLIIIIYIISIMKSRMLIRLKRYFDAIVKDLDEEYFGVKLVNQFGDKDTLFYALVPFIKPKIRVTVLRTALVR